MKTIINYIGSSVGRTLGFIGRVYSPKNLKYTYWDTGIKAYTTAGKKVKDMYDNTAPNTSHKKKLPVAMIILTLAFIGGILVFGTAGIFMVIAGWIILAFLKIMLIP